MQTHMEKVGSRTRHVSHAADVWKGNLGQQQDPTTSKQTYLASTLAGLAAKGACCLSSSRALAMSRCPALAATCSAVQPEWSVRSGSTVGWASRASTVDA